MDKFIDKLALDLICLHFDFAKSTSSVLIAQIHIRGVLKINLQRLEDAYAEETSQKYTLEKIHFRKIYFGCQSLNAVGPSISLVGTKCPTRPFYVRAIKE